MTEKPTDPASVRASGEPQKIEKGSHWQDADPRHRDRFVVVVAVEGEGIAYRNEATNRLAVSRTSRFRHAFKPASASPSDDGARQPQGAKAHTKGNPGAFDCYANAEPSEPLFILLGRDRDAPGLVRRWADQRESRGDSPTQIADARACADAMETWRTENRPAAASDDGAARPQPAEEIVTETCPRCGTTCPAGWCGACHQAIPAVADSPTCRNCGADVSLVHECFPKLSAPSASAAAEGPDDTQEKK